MVSPRPGRRGSPERGAAGEGGVGGGDLRTCSLGPSGPRWGLSCVWERGVVQSGCCLAWAACEGEGNLSQRCPAEVGGGCVGQCRPASVIPLCAELLWQLNGSLGTCLSVRPSVRVAAPCPGQSDTFIPTEPLQEPGAVLCGAGFLQRPAQVVPRGDLEKNHTIMHS